jgi:hypothetical protein
MYSIYELKLKISQKDSGIKNYLDHLINEKFSIEDLKKKMNEKIND